MRVIGVDPGKTTGLALSVSGELQDVDSEGIIEGMLWVQDHYTEDTIVVVEDARKMGYHPGNSNSAKWMNVGKVKRDCQVWEEFCEYKNYRYHLISPQNVQTKLDADYFEKVTGWEGRTNEHKRDAGMIAFQFNPDVMAIT